ncbi:MAG: hypothetical protein IT373_08830 [Polyangiaceae bacterium]|nr:hypothetical protein [Polyangiaceae bacterium]
MARRALLGGSFCVLALVAYAACGGRSSLPLGGTGGTTGGAGGAPPPCEDGETTACGTDVGVCEMGTHTCYDGVFGPCLGAIEATDEQCNDLDDDCDGETDEGFQLGEACDDADGDLCLDSVITCAGCSPSENNLEICNGLDENCNGIVDADCDFGDCQPALEVTGSTPSSPECIDFPVEQGSTGGIQYPCTGGPVSAQLGSVPFSGSVQNGYVVLDGIVNVVGPDNCLWQTSHHIEGAIASGVLSYSYAELLLDPQPFCWSPCTEVGTVAIHWTPI